MVYASIRYLLICSLTILICSTIHAQDVAGSKDHPIISRYPGSEITYLLSKKNLIE